MSTKPWEAQGLADEVQIHPKQDARRRKRLKLSLPVHLRPFDIRFRDIEDIGLVVDFTRDGLQFTTCMPHYLVGMRLEVTFLYGDKIKVRKKFLGLVVRAESHENGTSGVSVRFLL